MVRTPPQLTFYRAAGWLLARLPLRLSYATATRLGDLAWRYNQGVRSNFEHNQRRALGPGATDRAVTMSARAAIRRLALTYVDELRLPSLTSEQVRQLITIRGWEHVDAALAQGKGAIIVSGHYGAPNIVGHLFPVEGYAMTVVVEHIQPEPLFDYFSRLRRTHGLDLLPVDAPMLPLIRTLRKQNGIVALVCDRDINHSGIRIPFLGEETSVPTGPAQVAIATGAPVLIGHGRRRDDHHYEGAIEPLLQVTGRLADHDAAVREVTMQVMAALERDIRAAPSQWVMSVPLWC